MPFACLNYTQPFYAGAEEVDKEVGGRVPRKPVAGVQSGHLLCSPTTSAHSISVKEHPMCCSPPSVRWCLIVLGLALLCPPALAADWPQWRGPNRDGISPETGLLKEWPKDGPPLAWKITNLGTGFSPVA